MEHAHWIRDKEFWWGVYYCSKCSKRCEEGDPHGMKVIYIEEYNYCPYCGSKMDEMDDEEK